MANPVLILGGNNGVGSALASFLPGHESSWISGQVIPVDGGRSTLRVKG